MDRPRPSRFPKPLLTIALAMLAPLALGFVLVHLLWGILIAGLLFPILPVGACDVLVRFWSRILLVALGIHLQCDDDSARARTPGSLLLINHVSWVDVFVVAAVVPARFVAKSEIRSWPLAGRLAGAVGTVFIERGRRHAVAHVNRIIADRLRSGQYIGIFPEGTTTDGTQVLRFHANLVQAAQMAQAPVVPVALQYWQDGAPSTAAAFTGEMTLVESMWCILIAPRLRVRLQFLPTVECRDLTRQAIAQEARRAISRALALPEHDLPQTEDESAAMDELEATARRGG